VFCKQVRNLHPNNSADALQLRTVTASRFRALAVQHVHTACRESHALPTDANDDRWRENSARRVDRLSAGVRGRWVTLALSREVDERSGCRIQVQVRLPRLKLLLTVCSRFKRFCAQTRWEQKLPVSCEIVAKFPPAHRNEVISHPTNTRSHTYLWFCCRQPRIAVETHKSRRRCFDRDVCSVCRHRVRDLRGMRC
jgi:hypothetical protein